MQYIKSKIIKYTICMQYITRIIHNVHNMCAIYQVNDNNVHNMYAIYQVKDNKVQICKLKTIRY